MLGASWYKQKKRKLPYFREQGDKRKRCKRFIPQGVLESTAAW